MSFVVRALALVLLLMSATAAAEEPSPRTPKPATKLAVTFDDLPGSPVPQADSEALLSEIVRVLAQHRVGPVVGFAIGERLEKDPAAKRAVEVWSRAGHVLANHSYTHATPDQLGVEPYLADITRAELMLRALSGGKVSAERYFRFPYLDEGRSPADSKVLFRALGLLGYQVARVSVDFTDWAYADPYARCLARGDARALELLSQNYLESATARLAWAVAAAQSVVRRPFVQVLLLHANVATAKNLDALLSSFERAGVTYVPLAEALRDPVYTADYEAHGGSVLTMASIATGRALPPPIIPPLSLLELACR